MASPTPYELAYDFTSFQSANPTTPLPADKLEIEFNALQTTTDEIINNLDLIQRSDGQLANNSVGIDQIKSEVVLGLNSVSGWLTGTNYVVNDGVYGPSPTYNGIIYRCVVAHQAGVFSTDLAAVKWEEIVDHKQFTDAAATSASNAATSETNAATSESNAAVSEANAAASEASAAANAALLPLHKYNATVDPTINDDSGDGYGTGSKWLNTVSDEWFICSDATLGAAVWETLSLSTDDLGALAVLNTVNNSQWSGTDLAVINGGTGASTAAAARVALSAVGVVRMQVITASGTYTPDANLLYALAEAVGGGGAGGGSQTGFSGATGGGGAGGTYSRGLFTAAQIGASQVATIGAGGAAGTGGGTGGVGGDGGTTSLGSLITAPGGGGGASSGGAANPSAGGTPGATGTGDVSIPGAPGGCGIGTTGSSAQPIGGFGGSTFFGGGARGQTANGDLAGIDGAANTGGGGGGALSKTTGQAGGAGGSGYIVITEFCSQ
jgi:hypothetical protein